jgi:predicted permease
LGLALARFGAQALVAVVPLRVRATMPALAHASIDGRVLAYSCAMSIAAGLLFGIVPALRGSRGRVYDALKEGARGSTRARPLRDLLVIVEVALTIVLMSGAALFGRSLLKLLSVQLGFSTEHVITAGVLLPGASYASGPERIDFFNRLVPAIEALPGVESAGMVSKLPLDWGNSLGFDIIGRPPSAPGREPTASYRDADAGYFATLRIPVLDGRAFRTGDDAHGPTVGVVNRAFANAYFAGASPVGQAIVLGGSDTLRLVGMVGDVPIGNLEDKIPPTLYLPFAQDADIFMQLAIRTRGDPTSIGGAVPRVVARVDPRAAVTPAVTMDRLLAQSTSMFMRRFPLLLVGVFALATLALALVGIYGVVSYAVANRTRELGIRLALGASPRSVGGLIVRHGAWMAGAGVVIGVAAAIVLGRFVGGMLYGVSAHDPVSYEVVALLLGGSAVAATLLPARRASRVDPATALRAE